VGYFEPYATSHDALDRDKPMQEEARNAARAVIEMVRRIRSGRYVPPDQGLHDPRPK
jgi:hypothetical protein